MNQSLVRLGQQLRDIWQQLGLNQKISLVLSTGFVLAGLVTLTIWASRP